MYFLGSTLANINILFDIVFERNVRIAKQFKQLQQLSADQRIIELLSANYKLTFMFYILTTVAFHNDILEYLHYTKIKAIGNNNTSSFQYYLAKQ